MPQLDKFSLDLKRIEQSHLQYLSVGKALKLVQPEFAQRLGRALNTRLYAVLDSVANDMDLWSKSAMAQLDSQLHGRKQGFTRRIEAVDRIQQAASGLAERISEIEESESMLLQLEAHMNTVTSALMELPDEFDTATPIEYLHA